MDQGMLALFPRRPRRSASLPRLPLAGQTAQGKGEAQTDPTHTAVLGLLLEEKLKSEGDEVHLVYPGRKDPAYASITDFLIAKLKAPER